jgi:acetylornithine aminotransferase/acetylornithine/N-succinyldiaminopimelate aminotransferase
VTIPAASVRLQDLARRTAQTELDVYQRLPFEPVRGRGCYLSDEDGREYLDFYGAHAVALVGHGHPRVTAAVAREAASLLFYSSVAHSRLRVEAGERLLARAPYADSRLFHCCSGAEANEVAIKLARKSTGRRRVVSFDGAFHGRTAAALAACGIERYRATSGPVTVPHHVHVPFGDAGALDRAVDRDTAAILCEPIQSLAGVRTASREFFAEMARIAAARGALLVFDEVQTGLGRTGAFFYAETAGVRPDLMTLGKGLAGGLPAAAVIVAPHVAEHVRSGDHGSTFGGGRVVMAAMGATLDIIDDESLVDNARTMGRLLADRLGGLPGVVAVTGAGLLVGVVLDRPAKGVQDALFQERVLAGTAVDPHVLRLLPPLVVGAEEIEAFTAALDEALRATRPMPILS